MAAPWGLVSSEMRRRTVRLWPGAVWAWARDCSEDLRVEASGERDWARRC